MRYDIVLPQETFRGMSYGYWLALWNNHLLSADPDTYDGGRMLFLRGNLNYNPVAADISYPRSIDPSGIYDRTNEKGVRISETTSIFIPVITSCYTVGTVIDGMLLNNEEKVRRHVNTDIDEGGEMWATIMKKKQGKHNKVVKDIREYIVESPMFNLNIPENSVLNNKQYMPEEKPGVYKAVSCAYCVIIKSLPVGIYQINFGGKGRGSHYTNSVYDLFVEKKSNQTVRDASGKRSHSSG